MNLHQRTERSLRVACQCQPHASLSLVADHMLVSRRLGLGSGARVLHGYSIHMHVACGIVTRNCTR